jgi:hypothetical protein
MAQLPKTRKRCRASSVSPGLAHPGACKRCPEAAAEATVRPEGLGAAAGDHALHHVLKGPQGREDSPRRALPAPLASSIPQSIC